MFGNNNGPVPMFNMPEQESMIDIDNNQGNIDIDVSQMQAMGNQGMGMVMNNCSRPIIEPVQERVVHRTICHKIQHVCPIRTKIVNNHVYKHTYQPSYSCCEENTVQHQQLGSCCQFR